MEEEINHYYTKAKLAYEKKNFDYAKKLLEYVLVKKSDSQQIHRLLYLVLEEGTEMGAFGKENFFTKTKAFLLKIKGDILSIQKRFLRAALSYEKAFICQPKNLFFLNRAGQQFLKANFVDTATTIFEEILKTNPTYIPVLKTLASLYLERGESEKSLQIYERLHELLPYDLEIKNRIQRLHADQAIKKSFL